MKAINPSTGELIREYPAITWSECDLRLSRAKDAQRKWQKVSFDERARLLRRAGELLLERSPKLARLMAEEMGKPIKQGRAEIEKCSSVCNYYAENAARFLKREPVQTDATKSFVAFEPLGVVLAVMPWNFPFWQVFRFAAPTLMAGNGAVLKHASNVPGCAIAIEEVFEAAGLPTDLFGSFLVGSEAVNRLVEDPRIAAVTLTGSTLAGRSVASKAGSVLKKTVLELGGSDAYVVLHDADIPHAAAVCAKSRLINSGQSCIAAKRFIVVESVRAEFERRFVEEMARARVGDPLDEATDVGPQARLDLRDDLHEQVRRTIAGGAKVLLGGEVPDRRGAFYPPTVLTDVRSGMAAADEELFGPVAAVIPVRDETEAIEVANHSAFGLGSAVFTRDRERGERIASDQLSAGSSFVNDLVRSDPRLPFGGIKQSGYGRELSSFGIREFVNVKTVYVA